MPSVLSAFASALSARLPLMAAALWWSSGICLGFVAVPLVFQHAGSVALAARITPHLFAAQTWLALGCAFAGLRRFQPQAGAAASTIAAIVFYFMACFGNAQLENFFPIKANKAMSAKA